MSELVDTTRRRTVGVRDVPWVFLAPRRLFARVEDVAAYGWPLVLLLTAVTLVGQATVLTGLIDREVDRQVLDQIAQIDRQQRDVVERSELRRLYEHERKQGEFRKFLARLQVIVAEPVKALTAVLLVAAALYGVVALTGRKAEWHTLLTICVYAGFIDLARLLFELVLMLSFGTLEVYTSPAIGARWLLKGAGDLQPSVLAAVSGALSGLDPFRIWFWAVVAIGLLTTAQLSRRRAWIVCGLCWLAATGSRAALAVAAATQAARAAAG
ncbi:MAG TPA: YIP1 family protein [Phycisphaerae bacterium]|nr:YIP1 family protein [Phycisphaerae bacterium]HNU45986.1 YIP1 family protein [Phycisphaerae bacterium]